MVSHAACMASWARPMSTVLTGTSVSAMLPSVEPPGRSLRLDMTCTGTPAAAQAARNTAQERPSVA